MRQKDEVEKEIRSILLSYPCGVTLDDFLKSFKNLIGVKLPSNYFGYDSDIEFLISLSDIVNVSSDSSGRLLLTGIPDESCEHIHKLVCKQKRPEISSNCYHNLKNKIFVPGSLRAEILSLMSFYYKGITVSSFVIAFRKKYNRPLPLPNGLESLEDIISFIPELKIKNERKEKVIYFSSSGSKILQQQQTKGKKYDKVVRPTINFHKSGLPEEILENFRQLIQKYPEGIVNVDFPSLYEDFTKKELNILQLGYKSLNELVDAVPDILKRIKPPNAGKNLLQRQIIVSAGAHLEHSPKAGNSTSPSSQVQTSSLKVEVKEIVCNGTPSESETPKVKISESDVKMDVEKLLVSPEQQVSDYVEPNILQDMKGQASKRFIKLVQLCEEFKFHIINLEDQLFMTSGDVARLIWSEKDTSDLMDRLYYKEVYAPFIKLSKENYVCVFEQCIWFKIPEYEKLKSSTASLILYPIKCVLDILNVFGHPSRSLRLAIQDEVIRFDPVDAFWNEFTYDEPELSDSEKDIEKQLSKLCAYDLKAKKEVYKVKRIKLQMANTASARKEIERIDRVQKIIARKIQEIETICSQYSKCN